jgi:hypothetical protein
MEAHERVDSRATRASVSGDPRATGVEERDSKGRVRKEAETRSVRRSSAIRDRVIHTKRSGASSTRRRCSFRRPAITTARG